MVEQGLTYHYIHFSEVAIWKINTFKYHHRDFVKKKKKRKNGYIKGKTQKSNSSHSDYNNAKTA